MSVYKYKTRSGKIKWGVNIYTGLGEPRIRKTGFNTRAEARKYEVRQSVRFDEFDSLVTKYTVEEAFHLMVDEKQDKGSIGKSTLKTYEEDFKTIFNASSSLSGKTKLYNITSKKLQKRINEVTRYVKGERLIRFLNMFFNYLNYMGYISGNPARRVHLNKRVKKDKKVVNHEKKLENKAKYWNTDEAIEFVNKLKPMAEKDMSEMDKTILLLSLNVGFRNGEARGLRMSNLQKNKDGEFTIHIERQFGAVVKKYAQTKNRKDRYVPIDSSMSKYLQNYLDTCKKKQYESKHWKLTKDSPVFARNDKDKEEPIPVGHTNDMLRKFHKKYPALPYISSHGLRHTFASYLYNTNRLSLEKISRLLGHASVKVTTDYYIHYFGNFGEENIRRRMFDIDPEDEDDSYNMGLS